MRRIFRIVTFNALIALAVACSKEEQPNTAENGTIALSIDGLIDSYTPQDETKSAVQTVARVLWSDGDKVHVFDGSRHIGILTADITGTEGIYAKLSGTVQTPTGSVMTLVHSPQLPPDSAPALNSNKLCLDLSEQDGPDVPFLVYGTLPVPTSTSISNEVVKFSLATSVYKVNCTGLPESGDFIRAHVDNVNTVCTLALSEDSAPAVSGEKPGRLTRSGNGSFLSKDERAYISFAVVKTDAGERKVSIRKTVGVYSASFDNKSFDAAKAYNTIVITKDAYPECIPGTFTINDKHYCFSKGNLWYGKKEGAAEATFNFEDSQLYYPEIWDTNHVSHFYWSKSAEVACAEAYNDMPSFYDELFTENTDFTANGMKGIWHTLSEEDWAAIVFGGIHSIRAEITDSDGEVHLGLILLPDEYINPLDDPDKNKFTLEEFSKMEFEGAVFLPNAGYRTDATLNALGNDGLYLSSTSKGEDGAAFFFYAAEGDEVNLSFNRRSNTCYNLRLVTEMK